MRLHRLRLRAFGPFPGEETVDFDALGQDGLFLLRGRTGAGKSSVLDAVTFALYGDVPGERERTQLKSTHAEPEAEPFVELEFSVGEETVRVHRTPQYWRPKRRDPQNTVQVNQRISVERRVAGEWEPMTSGIQAANDELRRLLGLDQRQFTQVILLPQGAFAEFLHASSQQKQDLLKRLFDTADLQSLEALLREQARSARTEVQRIDDTIDQLTATLREDAARAVPQPSGEDAPGAEPDPQPLDTAELDAEPLCAAVEDLVDRAERYYTGLVQSRQAESQRVREDAEALTRRQRVLRRYAEHCAEAEGLAAQDARIADDERRVESHRQAVEITSWFTSAEEARSRSAAEAERARQAASTALALLRADANEAGEASTEAEVDLRAALDEAIRTQAQLEARDARALERQHSDRAAALTAARAASERAEQEHSGLLRAHAEAQRAQDEDVAQQEDPEALEALRERAESEVQRVTALTELARERDLVAQRGTEQAAGVERAAGRCETAAAEHQRLLQAHLAQVAARLADRLAEGEQCPVCGSREHPAPARAESENVTEDDVQRALDALQRERDALTQLEAAQAASDQRLGELHEALAGDAHTERTALEQIAGRAESQVSELGGRRKRQHLLAQRIEDRARELSELAIRRGDGEGRRREAAAELARRQAEWERAEQDLLELRAGYPSVEERESALQRLHAELRTAVEARDSAAKADFAVTESERAADQRLSRSPYADRQALSESVMDETTLTETTDRVARHREAQQRVRLEADSAEVVEGATRFRAGEQLPEEAEIAAAQAAFRTAEEAEQAARHLRSKFAARRESLDTVVHRLREALLVRSSRLQEQVLRTELAATVNGEGPDNPLRMTLTSFVLAARLERVAEAASRHLATMSEGRYRLLHDDSRRGGGKQGLELKVHDEHSDVERPTSSLSGGETFMAALSMALGLAEIVQEDSGGIGMETLFIDEGFGSLDDETLEHVMTALHGLQGEGRRVGVVSHVTEMHRAIPVQLQVVKERAGSTTRMLLP